MASTAPPPSAAHDASAVDEIVISPWALYELVEAAARSDQHERARAAADQLSQLAAASASDWARGAAARSLALVSGGRAAEEAYREAIELLGRTRMATHLARARLVYGEWLRREKRRIDARDQLRSAFDALASMGAEAFAERARRELLATGETVRKRSDDTRADLTPQEEEIARLARDGRTNHEIAAQLFIGHRTVEWHLRQGVRQAGHRLPPRARPGPEKKGHPVMTQAVHVIGVDAGSAADEVEQGGVHLGGVGPGDRVRAACHDDQPRVLDQAG